MARKICRCITRSIYSGCIFVLLIECLSLQRREVIGESGVGEFGVGGNTIEVDHGECNELSCERIMGKVKEERWW
jgi:hypothetical protein